MPKRGKYKSGLFFCNKCNTTYDQFSKQSRWYWIKYEWRVFGTEKQLCPRCLDNKDFRERNVY